MGKTIQLKDHAFNTLLYPITKAENIKFDGERDLVDEIESINGKIESIIQGESELEKYATTEYVDNNLANKADVGHIHQMQDIEGIEELEAQFDNMFEEYTGEQISVDFPNASTISIVDNEDLFTSTTIEGALRELANNSGSGDADGISFNNSLNGMEATNVQEAIEEVFQSVSNGKELVATAIADKGVQTSSNDTFQTMADNIRKIKVGTDVSIDNKPANFNFNLELSNVDRKVVSEAPQIEAFFASLAYHNKEIHLFEIGLHYKYTEDIGWEEIVDDVEFAYCDAISINNELHVLTQQAYGLDSDCPMNIHCKYDGNEWKFVSELPCYYVRGALTEFGGELHFVSHIGFLSSIEDSIHYRYDGNEWHMVHKFPFKLSYAKTFTINEEIHLLGCKENGEIAHCKYNGNEWEYLPIPIEKKDNELLVNAFELMGEFYAVLLNEDCVTTVYKCGEENWTEAFNLDIFGQFLSSVTTDKDLCVLNYSIDEETEHYNFTPLYTMKKK